MTAPQLHHFDQMPFEKMNNLVFRKYVAGKNGMFVYFKLLKGAVIPEHHHISEQITHIMKGHVIVKAAGQEYHLRAGDILVIPPNVPHMFTALEDTIDYDVFSPVREDWLKGTDNYLRK